MALSTFSVRMDDNLKKQFDSLCFDFGMTASTAFNIFARAVVRERKIPFKISAEPSDMTAIWTPEYWSTVREKLYVAEQQFNDGKAGDAFVMMEKAKGKYGL